MKSLPLLALALLTVGCGSRTGLLAPRGDAAAGDGGTSPQDSGADVGPLPCTATGPAGSMAWQLALEPGPMGDAGAMTFTGPWAADPTGATFYLGTAGAYPSTYSLIAQIARGSRRLRRERSSFGV